MVRARAEVVLGKGQLVCLLTAAGPSLAVTSFTCIAFITTTTTAASTTTTTAAAVTVAATAAKKLTSRKLSNCWVYYFDCIVNIERERERAREREREKRGGESCGNIV